MPVSVSVKKTPFKYVVYNFRRLRLRPGKQQDRYGNGANRSSHYTNLDIEADTFPHYATINQHYIDKKT